MVSEAPWPDRTSLSQVPSERTCNAILPLTTTLSNRLRQRNRVHRRDVRRICERIFFLLIASNLLEVSEMNKVVECALIAVGLIVAVVVLSAFPFH